MNFVKNLLTRTSRCMENQETENDPPSPYPSGPRNSNASRSSRTFQDPSPKAPLFGVMRCDSGNSSTAEPESDLEDAGLTLSGDISRDLRICLQKVGDANRWRTDRFEKIRLLQNAARNQGRVELMKEVSSGRFVAVKRMPIGWTGFNQQDFLRRHETELEMPWVDVALAKYLSLQRVNFVCDPVGTFRDECETFFVSSFADKGDLFEWCQNGPTPGLEREALLRPLVQQLFDAMKYLHGLEIAHCDLSLENILLMTNDEGNLQIKLIDFGMAAIQQHRIIGARGKPSYQAPEMHRVDYDPLLSDTFAVGVVVFGMVAQDYPWLSTKPAGCKCFDFASTKGLRAYLHKRKARNSNGARLAEVFTERLMELLDMLLQLEPENRARLEQTDFPWLDE